MSTIRVDNFGPSAGGTTYSARGIAKAWVNFDGTGTIAARDSENVSSLTDNATGGYGVNLTNSMANTNGAVVSMCHYDGVTFMLAPRSVFNTVSIIRVSMQNAAGAASDANEIAASGYGDLA